MKPFAFSIAMLLATALQAQFHFVNLPLGAINDFLYSPDSGGTVYAASENGWVYYTHNNGNNWYRVKTSTPPNATGVNALAITPSKNIVAATFGQGVFIWNGISWATSNTGLPTFSGAYPYFKAIVSDTTGKLFAGSRTLALQKAGAYIYNSGNWTTDTVGLTNKEVNCMAVSPANVVYAGTDGGIFFYNGISWTAVNTGLQSMFVYSLLFGSNGDLYAGTATGVSKLPSGNTSWTSLNTGLPSKPVLSLEFDPSTTGKIIAGLGYTRDLMGTLYGQVYISTNSGNNWNITSSTPTTAAIRTLCITPTGNIFASGLGAYFSSDGGASWGKADNGFNNTISMRVASTLEINPQGDIFIGTENGIFKSTDGGATWTESWNGLQNPFINTLACDPGSGYLFASGYSGFVLSFGSARVYRSMDGGNSWDTLSISLDWNYKDFSFSGSGKIYCAHGFGSPPPATFPGSILAVSSDNGNSWTDLNLVGEGAGFSVDVNSQGHIFVASETGAISRSVDGGNTWVHNLVPYGNSGPVRISPNDDIFAGTQTQYPVYYSTAASNGNIFDSIPNGWPQYKSLNDIVFDSFGNAYFGTSPQFGQCGINKLAPPFSSSSVFAPVSSTVNSIAIRNMKWDPCGHLFGLGPGSLVESDSSLTTPTTLCNPIGLTEYLSISNVSCNGGSNGTASVTAIGGVSPYSYSWNTIPVQTTSTATGLSAGTYTVIINDAGSSADTATVTITEPSPIVTQPSSSNASSATANDGSANVTATGGTPPFTYSWSNGGSSSQISNLTSQFYFITVTDANGCSKTDSVFVDFQVGIRNEIGGLCYLVNVFPNPFLTQTTLNISSSEKLKGVEIKIFDVFGKEVRKISEINYSNIKIERGNLADGIYYYKVASPLPSSREGCGEIIGKGKFVIQ